MAEIRLDRVSKVHADGTTAVRDASFTVGDGEFFVLVGPSGCGKSTLLNLIVGLDAPSSGKITVDGRSMQGVDPKDRNMAMVFQSYALYPHMTVTENLAFPLRLARRPKAEIAARVAEVAALLALTDLLERRPDSLSGGQRQRVAMGRAMVRRPQVFLLDEPLSNLDAQFRAQMRAELARLQRRLGTTTVYVTHDQTEAMTLGDRLAVMRQGAVQQVGTPREVYAAPANLFVAAFIGSPAMNVLPGRLEGNRLVLPMGDLPLSADQRRRRAGLDGPVVVGIRPEHLALAQADGGDGAFTATVDLVEWLGAELFVHLDAGPQTLPVPTALAVLPGGAPPDRLRLVARLSPAAPPDEGATLRVALDAAAIHLFHPESGDNLRGDAKGD